jgi:polysaccharide export outer membrane protein
MAGLPLAEAAETKTNATPAVVSPNQLDDTTKIGIGDVISFRIVEDRDQAKNLIVTDSGEVDVPYVGRIKAVNKTSRQIAVEAKALLEKDYYHVATLVVAIDRVGARNMEQVFVQGAVGRAGYLDIAPGDKPTLSKIIQFAGGLAPTAKSKVKVTRTKPGGTKEIIWVDMKEIQKDGNKEKDILILPGDHILVEQRVFNFL